MWVTFDTDDSGERPTLGEVDLIRCKDGSEFRLIDLITDKCEDISKQFKIPPPKHSGWKKKRLGDQREVCHEMLQHWLQSGTGPYPVTWSGLIKVLKDVELGEEAKKLETALLNKIED